ncbi:hypothetical protein DACRYDRAFT_20771 [Dacryopinax primogenitus]|uniref:Uncharacterized protein n=1 Tax=Dacryopinax primogenitus (strain DJM 731) TaxID=1858805 RepID=M5G7K8_DACPD|nr:uncharacterized protein DACRYDRAFT_20771 [Dacryopinax primogenitus]EJU04150.1 hypothetical protein DACRYDRAFT_20771 [Dacryopinax primogenitus]
MDSRGPLIALFAAALAGGPAVVVGACCSLSVMGGFGSPAAFAAARASMPLFACESGPVDMRDFVESFFKNGLGRFSSSSMSYTGGGGKVSGFHIGMAVGAVFAWVGKGGRTIADVVVIRRAIFFAAETDGESMPPAVQ